ncbi:ras GTPase-activating protein 3 isoform X1 [Lates japonicus]|uniref:Ras GTPase-activating protein 3 isoform X1 n=1 Tax=Lates japonicus TaxID=270547 RepID=A0AAD3RJ76_LATJO|nr:ras GTPase-activating protein 3 isoform X1 [Lates japonicus]
MVHTNHEVYSTTNEMFQVIRQSGHSTSRPTTVWRRRPIDISTKSQPVQPQTPEHLPSSALPQRPLALLQALSGQPWVYAPALAVCPRNIQLDDEGREIERIYSCSVDIHDQTDQDARSDTDKTWFACAAVSLCTTGPSREEYSSFVIDDQETYKPEADCSQLCRPLTAAHIQRDKFKKTKIVRKHPIGDRSQCHIRQQSESSTYSI